MTDEEKNYFEEQINKSNGKTDLVCITYYRDEFTKKCLEYLFERTKTPYRLTVVDNGSKDSTVDYLMSLKMKEKIDNLILLDRNYGLEYARNTALRHIHSDYCVFFDNDLLVPDLEPDWLAQELKLIKDNPEFGCVALRPQVLVGADNNKFQTDKEIVENNHVGATFMMLPTELLKEIGWANEFTNRMADHRLGSILKERNLKMGWCRNIFCYHLFGKNWNYPEEVKHFHREIWPPSEYYDSIKVDEKTLQPL